jgi:hypothetical protein
MVAAALSIVIMTIMALAFQSAMSTLSNLKSMGDQADRLRTAEVMLRADLDSDHIVGDDGGGILKVSDLRFDDNTKGPTTVKNGYFAITTGSVSEGNDNEVPAPGIPSTKMSSPTANTLSMTIKRTSRTTTDLFGSSNTAVGKVSDTLNDPAVSQWAEVRWQLSPTARTNINGVNLYSLHRRVIPISQPTTTTPVTDMNAAFKTTFDPNANGGDDIVLTNVVSFEVKPLLFNKDGQNISVGTDTPYSDSNWSTVTYANAAATSVNPRCVAVLVKVRLYDIKTKLTRQMSLIVKI